MAHFAGWCIKFFDEIFQNKISTEFKIHINNFSGVILGSVLAIFAYIIIGPVINFFNNILCSSIEFIIKLGFIPLISILIEPAKILFLSDTINNSIFNWVGIQEYQEFGKSIFFMIIANPGPGLGVLLAFCLAGKDMAKSFAPGAVIIHFLGGIHEIYFPYIFMKPILLLAVIPASMAGIFILSVLNGGLVAPISTSSIFTILAMMPQDAYFANIIAIVVATTVSFIITFRIIRPTKEIICSLENTASGAKNYSNNNVLVEGRELKKIVYVCDAGLGSSAIGVNLLYNKLKKAGYGDISVTNCVIGNIPSDAQIVVSYESLADYVIADSPQAEHLFVQDFTKNDVYNIILAKLKNKEEKLDLDIEKVENMDNDKIVLRRENIKMNLECSY